MSGYLRLEGKRTLVTGGTKGVGQAVVEVLHEACATVPAAQERGHRLAGSEGVICERNGLKAPTRSRVRVCAADHARLVPQETARRANECILLTPMKRSDDRSGRKQGEYEHESESQHWNERNSPAVDH
jgi:NAD(P)-dependent dehydrogenase (short-subunit alcohol dehydrogenase family)